MIRLQQLSPDEQALLSAHGWDLLAGGWWVLQFNGGGAEYIDGEQDGGVERLRWYARFYSAPQNRECAICYANGAES